MLFKPSAGNLGCFALPLSLEFSKAHPLGPECQSEAMPCWGLTLWLGGEKGFGAAPSDAFPLHPSSSHIPRASEACWWQGWCIPGRGGDSSFGKSSSENFGRPWGGDGGIVPTLGLLSPTLACPWSWQGWSRHGELLLFLSCSRKDFCECHKPSRGQSLGEL